jgi:phage terminase small subunit
MMIKDDLLFVLDNELTPKQVRFAKVYLETLGNATEAAWQAYNCSSRDSAKALGYRVKRQIIHRLRS